MAALGMHGTGGAFIPMLRLLRDLRPCVGQSSQGAALLRVLALALGLCLGAAALQHGIEPKRAPSIETGLPRCRCIGRCFRGVAPHWLYKKIKNLISEQLSGSEVNTPFQTVT